MLTVRIILPGLAREFHSAEDRWPLPSIRDDGLLEQSLSEASRSLARQPAGAGLGGRVAVGIAWLGGSFGGLRLIGLVQTVIMARLLSPADFGTYAMVNVVLGTLGVLTGFGIREGVIQSPHDDRATLDTAFCLILIRGFLLYTLVYFSAPLVEDFFATPDVAVLLRVGGLSILLGAACNVGPMLFAKKLDYRSAALYGQFPQLVAMIAGIGFAIWLRSVWALVLSQLTASALLLPLSYWVHDFRPRLRIHRAAGRHLLRYGGYILGSAPFFYLSTHIDEIVVGRRFGSHSLGAYQLAYNVSALPATYFGDLVLGVLFPIFAQLQSTPKALGQAYVKTLRHLASLSLPLSAFLFVFASEIIHVVYGSKWAAAIPLLMAFSIYGALRSVMSISLQIFKATGQTRVVFQLAVLNLAAVGLVVLVGAPYGPFWIAVLLSAASIPAAVYGLRLTAAVLDLSLVVILRACVPSALATGAVLLVALGARPLLDEWPQAFVRLVAGATVFAAGYTPLLLLLDRRWLIELVELVRAARLSTASRRMATDRSPA
ncbi:MAG: lipopolysaccharide biosynthesis protein [Candidatus Binatia bacterium]